MKLKILTAVVLASLSSHSMAATYKLTELPRHENSKYSYIVDANNNGDMIGRASNIFNLPIDVSYIDFEDNTLENFYNNTKRQYEEIDEEISFTLADIQNGAANTNADAHAFMLRYLSAQINNTEFQKLEDDIGLIFNFTKANEQNLFDKEEAIYPGYSGKTRSVTNHLTAIADGGAIVGWGSSPYSKQLFTPEGEEQETHFIRDWLSRGIIITPEGESYTIEPAFTEHGGVSLATDIVLKDDGSYIVVGQSSVSIPENRQEDITDDCDGVDETKEVCIWRIQKSTGERLYDKRAYMWTYDSTFNLVDSKNLGLGLIPEDDEDNAFVSMALAVNKAGVAVGYSRTRVDDSLSLYEQPGYFVDGEFKLVKEREYRSERGKAVGINNNGVVIGYTALQSSSSLINEEGFYYDINSNEFNEVPGFFNGSDMMVTDINDAGYIIGQSEIEKSGSNRRREGFIFKIGDSASVNLNTLLPCKDASGQAYPYTIAETVKITEDNRIYAIATKTVERRNTLGEVEKDSNGEIEFETVTLPVLLEPIPGGEIESCTPPEAETYERGSASWGLFSLLALPLAFIRRRKSAVK